MSPSFNITDKTKSTERKFWRSVPFQSIKNRVLGKNYELSLVFVGNSDSQKLNKKYRSKNKPTNVLSFPIEKNVGEIFICIPVAKKEAMNFERSLNNFIALLFIHGLLHLKGMKHGKIMDKAEEKFRKKFAV